MLYLMHVTVIREEGCFRETRHMPTFLFDSDVFGLKGKDAMEEVARGMFDQTDRMVEVTARAVELTRGTLTEDDHGHIEYLKGTLIPDLHDSGMDATAQDYETCIEIIERIGA
jgi:hypothetical protein